MIRNPNTELMALVMRSGPARIQIDRALRVGAMVLIDDLGEPAVFHVDEMVPDALIYGKLEEEAIRRWVAQERPIVRIRMSPRDFNRIRAGSEIGDWQ